MMQSIAGNMPGYFTEPEAYVSLHQLAKRLVVLYLAHEGFAPDANCRSWNTDVHIYKGSVHTEQSDELGDALDANGCDLDNPPVFHGLGSADQSPVDEMNELDRLSGGFD